jgi:hypothetical protein
MPLAVTYRLLECWRPSDCIVGFQTSRAYALPLIITLTDRHRSVTLQGLGLEERALQYECRAAVILAVSVARSRRLRQASLLTSPQTSSNNAGQHLFGGVMKLLHRGKCSNVVRTNKSTQKSVHLGALNSTSSYLGDSPSH